MSAALIMFMVLKHAQHRSLKQAPTLGNAFSIILTSRTTASCQGKFSHCLEFFSFSKISIPCHLGAASPTTTTTLIGHADGTPKPPGPSSAVTLLSPHHDSTTSSPKLWSPWLPNTVRPLVLYQHFKTFLFSFLCLLFRWKLIPLGLEAGPFSPHSTHSPERSYPPPELQPSCTQ